MVEVSVASLEFPPSPCDLAAGGAVGMTETSLFTDEEQCCRHQHYKNNNNKKKKD